MLKFTCSSDYILNYDYLSGSSKFLMKLCENGRKDFLCKLHITYSTEYTRLEIYMTTLFNDQFNTVLMICLLHPMK